MKSRVLVVDDEEAILEALKAVFEDKGHDVQTALTAEEALVKTASGKPVELFLVDKNLPKMSGLDFIREIRKTNATATIVLITGYSSIDSARDALNIDVDAYLEKPFENVLAVVELAQNAADRRKRRRAVASIGSAVRILIAAPPGPDRNQLASTLEGHGTVAFAATPEDLNAMLQQAHSDAVVIDARPAGAKIVEVVSNAVAHDPLATYIVIYAGDVGLPVLQQLIELGVKGLFDARSYAHDLRELIEKIAKRRRQQF